MNIGENENVRGIVINIKDYDKEMIERMLYAVLTKMEGKENYYYVNDINWILLFYNFNHLLKFDFKIQKEDKIISIELI